MDNPTGAVGQARATDAEWPASYVPIGLSESTWSAAKPFVIGCAHQLGLGRGASSERVVRVLARLAAWSVAQGLALDAEVVLDPDNVERFVTASSPSPASRATYRSVLRRVGPLLTERAPWEPRPAPASRRQVAAPYTDREVGWLCHDALRQPTEGRVRAARAILALGLGAGLDGRWVARVRSEDVESSTAGVSVRVGEPSPRIVPVLATWESEIRALAGSAGDEFLVGGRPLARNRAGSLASSLVVGHGHPTFSASRLRSTWLLTHLRLGSRLPELAAAAGFVGITVLSDLLTHVPRLDGTDVARMLRGQL